MPIILLPKISRVFHPGDSTINQLLFLVGEIHQAFEDTKSVEVRAVFLTFLKPSIKFFESYLHDRKQRVVLNGSFSDYSVIQSGVPQGSVLSDHYYFSFISMTLKSIQNPISIFLLMISCFFL